MNPGSTLRVLASFPPPRATTNPYIVMLARALAADPGVRLEAFSWRNAVLRRYDVFHAHWPENLVTGGARWKRAARQVLFLLFVVLLRLRRTAVVRTVHNLKPHERLHRVERVLLSLLERQTVQRIALNSESARPGASGWTTIPHGHYITWFEGHPRSTTLAGRLVFAGLVRPYKNVSALVEAFTRVEDPDLSLRVVGRPAPDSLTRDLELRAGRDPRVSLDLRHLTDEELVREVTRAELVVLPYAEMHNSGAAIMALSLGRAVLVPDNPVNRSLAGEVGPGWVLRYDGVLSPSVLVATLSDLRRADRVDAPDLSARDWETTATRHVDVYRAAVAGARGRSHSRSTRPS